MARLANGDLSDYEFKLSIVLNKLNREDFLDESKQSEIVKVINQALGLAKDVFDDQ